MLSGKTAVVTGASRGIGRAIALELASRGMQIAAIYAHGEAAAQELCEECRERFHVTAKAFQCDVADSSQVKKTTSEIRKEFGGVYLLVNNAGITRDALIIAMKEEDYDAVLDTNLKGAFLMSKSFLPILMRGQGGCIINISSISGVFGNPGQAAYAASKAGIIGLTKTIAKEYARKGIRCCAIAPGFISTDMTKALPLEELETRIPLGRTGLPEDVAKAAAYLAGAGYVTGEVLRVDGGIAM